VNAGVAAKMGQRHNGAMNSDSSNILDAALSLSDPERASLAYRLLRSLKPPRVLSDSEADFDSELERRVNDNDA
jgi:hypothetical protein